MIEVLFFARLRESLDLARLALELSEPTTVGGVKAQLAARGANWQALFAAGQVLAAVNQELANDATPIRPGDEVAFFPPATGG
ncbi:MAG: molybdopterin converting factor subunit 1 [Porticoccaceae bacterium]